MIVGPGMTFAYHAHATPHTALNHEINGWVGDEVQRDTRLLEDRIPRQLGCAEVLRRINLETPLLHSHLSELLKHVGEDQ